MMQTCQCCAWHASRANHDRAGRDGRRIRPGHDRRGSKGSHVRAFHRAGGPLQRVQRLRRLQAHRRVRPHLEALPPGGWAGTRIRLARLAIDLRAIRELWRPADGRACSAIRCGGACLAERRRHCAAIARAPFGRTALAGSSFARCVGRRDRTGEARVEAHHLPRVARIAGPAATGAGPQTKDDRAHYRARGSVTNRLTLHRDRPHAFTAGDPRPC